MKKIVIVLLVLILVIVTGCRGGKDVPPTDTETIGELGVDELSEDIDALDDLEDLEDPEIDPNELDLS